MNQQQKRHPAGTPDGGKFAPDPKQGPNVTLAAPPARAARPDEDALYELTAEKFRIEHQFANRSARDIAAVIQRNMPTASHVDLEPSDQDTDLWALGVVHDGRGNNLGYVLDNVSPDDEDTVNAAMLELRTSQRYTFVREERHGDVLDLTAAADAGHGEGPLADMGTLTARYRDVHDHVVNTSARVLAARIRDHFPDASTVTVEASDQGDYFELGTILDADGNELDDYADWSMGYDNDDAAAGVAETLDVIDAARREISTYEKRPFIRTSDDNMSDIFDLDEAARAGLT